MADESGYIDFFEILGVAENAKTAEVRSTYKKKMKDLLWEIQHAELTEGKRAQYLLQMAQLNASFVILRDTDAREQYARTRQQLIELEQDWRDAVEANAPEADNLRRSYEGQLRDFLSHYCETVMLDAGYDKECMQVSHWDQGHARHASKVLRHYRHRLQHDVLERLPFTRVTPPEIELDERKAFAAAVLAQA